MDELVQLLDDFAAALLAAWDDGGDSGQAGGFTVADC